MGTADRDPLVDERARVGAADARFGCPKMAQPAEAEKRGRPLIGRRRDFEGRAGIAGDDLARKREAACVNFACPSAITRSQVLRRDDDTVGLGEGKRPVEDRMRGDAAGKPAKEATRQDHGQLCPFRDRNARHRGANSPPYGRFHPRNGNIAKGRAVANRG